MVENKGRTEIGRRSDGVVMNAVFGIGVMMAVFHCDGTVEFASDMP
jgi:hypothetical protein